MANTQGYYNRATITVVKSYIVQAPEGLVRAGRGGMGRKGWKGMLSLVKCKLTQETEAGLLNKSLMLSSSFRCDQSYKYELYDFGHTLLCYLSRTLMFNKLASVDGGEDKF